MSIVPQGHSARPNRWLTGTAIGVAIGAAGSLWLLQNFTHVTGSAAIQQHPAAGQRSVAINASGPWIESASGFPPLEPAQAGLCAAARQVVRAHFSAFARGDYSSAHHLVTGPAAYSSAANYGALMHDFHPEFLGKGLHITGLKQALYNPYTGDILQRITFGNHDGGSFADTYVLNRTKDGWRVRRIVTTDALFLSGPPNSAIK